MANPLYISFLFAPLIPGIRITLICNRMNGMAGLAERDFPPSDASYPSTAEAAFSRTPDMSSSTRNRRMQPAGPIILSELIHAFLLEMAVLVHLHLPPSPFFLCMAPMCRPVLHLHRRAAETGPGSSVMICLGRDFLFMPCRIRIPYPYILFVYLLLIRPPIPGSQSHSSAQDCAV